MIFDEIDDSPRLKVTPEGVMGTRKFLIAWSDRTAFCLALLGGYRATGGLFDFTPASQLPEFPQCVCSEVEIVPWPLKPSGSPSLSAGLADHEQALVTATYRVVEDPRTNKPHRDAPTVPAGTFLTWTARSRDESLSVPGMTWKWEGTAEAAPVDMGVRVLLPTTEHRLVWSKVPKPPWTAIRELRGKVNSGLFLGAAAETVLFAGYESRVVYQIDGNRIYTLTYTFVERTVQSTASPGTIFGWNHFYRKAAVANEHWQRLVANDGTATPPFLSADFSPLFAFEA
jgi:hypothetical protein